MKAILKAAPAPGCSLLDVPEPQLQPGHVRIRVKFGSVCGTDLHIYDWNEWAASRIHPPRIIGHEFSGVVEEVAPDVTVLKPGDEVASESHITCGRCRQCLEGKRHVCVNTRILGVDVDGGFATYAVIPWENARPTFGRIPLEVACVQDPLGNAVHTVFAGPVEGQNFLITGMGPIGLFAVGVCKAAGAASVAVTEVSPFRLQLAERMGADLLINPIKDDAAKALQSRYPDGVDAALEMAGKAQSLNLCIEAARPGGRVSLLGLFDHAETPALLNEAIFKGLEVQCIVGRRLWETWEQMGELLSSGRLNVTPVLTHRYPFTEFSEAMERMKAGLTGKVVFEF